MKITKKQLRRIIKEELSRNLLNESHPYDASINDALDAGYFSNSDAVDEVQAHLRKAGAMDLVDEIAMMIDYGDDDIYAILDMIPKNIKDKLPIG